MQLREVCDANRIRQIHILKFAKVLKTSMYQSEISLIFNGKIKPNKKQTLIIKSALTHYGLAREVIESIPELQP